eukprot:EG_transcript_20161
MPGPFLRLKGISVRSPGPLLQLWVLYHAHVFGFQNIIVLDESTRQEPLTFLQRMQQLGMTVLRTSGGLNKIQRAMDYLFGCLRWSADYFIKLDTDEFLISFDTEMSIDANDVFKSIRTAKLNGHRGRITRTFLYEPNDTNVCWPLGETFNIHDMTSKAFLPAATFSESDIGFHICKSMPEFNEEKKIPLSMLHFHFLCYDEWIWIARDVLLSHHYLQPGDTKKQQLKKLKPLARTQTTSFHKVRIYLEHLTNEANLRKTTQGVYFKKSSNFTRFPQFNELLSK